MGHQNNKIIKLFNIMIYMGCILIAGCGVKGKPLPPLTPPYIGSGQRTNADVRTSDKNVIQIVRNNHMQNENKDRK